MRIFKTALTAALFGALAMQTSASVGTANLKKSRAADKLVVSFDLVLDSLRLGSDKQLYITPVVENGKRLSNNQS